MPPIIRPRFSVLMPTRQRHDTLYHAMRTVLMQDYDDFELVVIDNMSSPETAEVVHAFGDPRVRYERTGRRLAMSDNWEFGLSHARGEYVTVLGDDDGLVPGAFGEAEAMFAQTGLSVLGWFRPHYYWPNARMQPLRDRFFMPVHNQPRIIESHDVLKRFYAYETEFNELPMIYNAFVHRSIIEAVKSRHGRYFNDAIPDVYSGIVNAHVAGRYAYMPHGIGIAGVSGHSTGSSQSGCEGEGSSAATFANEYRESELSLAPHPLLIDSKNIDIMIARTKLRAQAHFFADDTTIRFEMAGLLRVMAAGLGGEPEAYDEAARALLALSDKYGFGITPDMLPPKQVGPWRSPAGLIGANVWVDCKPLHVSNVYEVAQAIGAIRQFHGAIVPIAGPGAVASAPAPATVCSIVMVLGDHLAHTQRCLEALVAHTAAPAFELILIDNGTTDGTSAWLEALEGDLVVHRNDRPVPEGQAKNQGAALAKGRQLVFLSPEAVPLDGWLEGLSAEADAHPDAAIVGALILSGQTGAVLHAGVTATDDGFAILGQGLPADDPAVAEPVERELVAGACMLVTREAFDRFGGFEPDAELDDLMLCLTARQAGLKVRFAPAARLWMDEAPADASAPDIPAEAPPGAPGVRWEGAELSVHSFAHVNREVVRRLIKSGRVEVSCVTHERAEFKPDASLWDVERSINRPLTRPTAVTVRHQWPPDFTAPPEGAWVMMQPWEFGGLPDAWVEGMKDGVDEMWVYTHWLRDCYVKSGLPADRVHVVPLGVDTERFAPEGPRYPLKTTKRFKFLFLGGTIPRKGIDALIEAYLSTFTADDDVCLVIKGIGADTFYRNSSPLNAMIRELAASDAATSRLPAVEFLDAALTDDEVASIYRACDALVHPYRGEGFGLPMAEAMASGLPVIVTGLGAAMDFCDESNAYLIPAENVPIPEPGLGPSRAGYWWAEPDRQALGRLMREVASHPDAAREKGRAGRARILRDFRWDAVAEQVLARLEALAGRVPVRFRAPEPFRPGLAPWPLDAHRRVVFFHQPDWATGAWREVLTSYARALPPDADATLVLWLDPANGPGVDAAASAIMGALAEAGLSPEAMPDVLLVPEALDDEALARLYTAADWVVPAGDATQAARAALVGRPVLAELTSEAWHRAIAGPVAH